MYNLQHVGSPGQHQPAQPSGVALLDYCVQAGMRSGPFGPTTHDTMNSLWFIIHGPQGTHIIDQINDIEGGINVHYCETVRIVDSCLSRQGVLSETNR